MSQVEKAREERKRPHQKGLLIAGSSITAAIVCSPMTLLLEMFF